MTQQDTQLLHDSALETPAFPDYHQLAHILALWEGKVLLLHRLTEPFKGFWSVPGGGVEKGEQYVDAARRELGEEAGIDSASLEPLYIFVDHVHHLESHIYSYTSPDGKFANREAGEHDELAWKAIDDALKLQLTPGVRDALEQLPQLP